MHSVSDNTCRNVNRTLRDNEKRRKPILKTWRCQFSLRYFDGRGKSLELILSASTTVPLPSPFPSSSQGKCPKNALQLGVCSDLLNDLLHHVLGSPATMPCCSLISGLVDLEAAVCLCTVIKANIIGINFDIPISLNLLINNCGKSVPIGYKCK
nr:14 kDa proline-rich protein DC2.15-like [Ipomoea batatas]